MHRLRQMSEKVRARNGTHIPLARRVAGLKRGVRGSGLWKQPADANKESLAGELKEPSV